MMPVYVVDPLLEPRWAAFLEHHPCASVFHTPGWLEALHRTYGYQPVVFTSAPPGEKLRNGIAACTLKSCVRAPRIVSLPFSDHCQPLAESPEELGALLLFLREQSEQGKWKSVELRPVSVGASELAPYSLFSRREEFYFHRLDLRPELDVLFRNFHKSCVQRKIHRAQREGLEYESGRSEPILAKFYNLLVLTRRRHRLPPQPLAWFRNLVQCLGTQVTIRIVSKDGRPVAAILTLLYGKSLVYKYGCSDASRHCLGGMPLLFWNAIQEGKTQGACELDLGRSELNNPGLVAFKEHWGAVGSKLCYFGTGVRAPRLSPADWRLRLGRRALACAPIPLLRVAGNILYRYFG